MNKLLKYFNYFYPVVSMVLRKKYEIFGGGEILRMLNGRREHQYKANSEIGLREG